MCRPDFGRLEAGHQAEIIGGDGALPTLVSEAASFAMPIDSESRLADRENANRFHCATRTVKEGRKCNTAPPKVGADDGDATRRRFAEDVPDYESIEAEDQSVEIRDPRARGDTNRHVRSAFARVLQSVWASAEIRVDKRQVRRDFQARPKLHSSSVEVHSLHPLVEFVEIVLGQRAPRQKVMGLQRAVNERFQYGFCDGHRSALLFVRAAHRRPEGSGFHGILLGTVALSLQRPYFVAMGHESERLDPAERAREKYLSREEDARALVSGEKSRAQLRRENGLFAFPNVRVSLRGAKPLE